MTSTFGADIVSLCVLFFFRQCLALEVFSHPRNHRIERRSPLGKTSPPTGGRSPFSPPLATTGPHRLHWDHGLLPTHLPRLRPRLRRKLTHPDPRIVPFGSLAGKRFLLRQPPQPVLGCSGGVPRRADADERRRKEIAPPRKRHRPLGRHRGMRHQGVERRLDQKRRTERPRGHFLLQPHPRHRLQRPYGGAPLPQVRPFGPRNAKPRCSPRQAPPMRHGASIA